MSEHELPNPRSSGLATDLDRARERADDLRRDSPGVGRLRKEDVGVTGQVDQLLGRPAVARIDNRSSARADPDADIGSRVRKKRRQNLERPDGQLITGFEMVDGIRADQDLGSIEREDGIKCARQGVDRERWQGSVRPRMGSENRIEIGAVVRVCMADEHCIELGRVVDREGRGHPVAGVDKEAEAIRLDDERSCRR
jgi:hypothetical protein